MNPLLARLSAFTVGHFVVAGIVVGGLIHFMKLSSHAEAKERLDQKQVQVTEIQEKLKKGQSLSQARPQYEQDIADTKQVLETAIELIPALHSQREIIELLSEKAKATNVRLPVLKPGGTPAKGGAYYTAVPYDLEIEGDFTRIASFFYELTKAKNILHVQDISFDKKVSADGKALLLARASISAFAYSKKVGGIIPPKPGGG